MPFLSCACGRRFETRLEWTGKSLRFPSCKASVGGPVATAVEKASPPPPRACPFCAETIHAAAIKCPHCRERLDRTPRPPWPRVRDSGGGGILAMAVLGLVLCGILAPVAWAMGRASSREQRPSRAESWGWSEAASGPWPFSPASRIS